MEQKKATQVNGCKQCKKGLNLTQKVLIGLSVYVFLSSVYGTIEIIKFLYNFF